MSARPLLITFADKTTVEVQPNLEDRLKFETTLRKNKGWGDLKDNSLKLNPFLGWSAASRTGKTTLTWAEFTSGPTAAIDVEVVSEADDDDADTDAEDLEVKSLGKDTPPTAFTTSPLP